MNYINNSIIIPSSSSRVLARLSVISLITGWRRWSRTRLCSSKKSAAKELRIRNKWKNTEIPSPAYSWVCTCVCKAQIDQQGYFTDCWTLNNFSSKVTVQFALYNVIPSWDKIQLLQIDPVFIQSLYFSYVNHVVFVRNKTSLGLTVSTPLKWSE